MALTLAALFFGYASQFETPPFLGGDAEQYWHLGGTFFPDGAFGLLRGEPTFRGYLLPLMLGALQQAAAALGRDGFQAFYLFDATVTALFLAVVSPALIEKLFGRLVAVWQVAAFAALFAVFWRGYLVEPLSDTWSLFLVATALLAVMRATDGARGGIGAAVLSGVLMGAAVNLRPIYLICLPLFAVSVPLLARATARRRVALLAGALAGVAAVLLPQGVINHHFLNSWNPLIHSGDLYTQQVYFGLAVQRHECAYFIDPAGIEVLRRVGLTPLTPKPDGDFLFVLDVSQQSLAGYVRLALSQPLDVLSIYGRHVANGMTLLGGNIYFCTPATPRTLFGLASILTVVLAAAAALLVPPKPLRRRFYALLWLPLLPIAPIVPTAMEGRFFFPLHLAAYGMLCFLVPWARLTALARRPRGFAPVPALAPAMVAVLAVTVLTCSVVSGTFASTYLWLGASPDGVALRRSTVLWGG